MKAVVLEVRDGLAAVLREDGMVQKLRRSCEVGDTIELPDETKIVRFPGKTTKWVAAAAAAVIIMAAGGTYGYNTAYAYSYVTLEGDASVVYVLNRQDRVIRVNGLSEDGKILAEELTAAGVKNTTLTEAITMTTEILGERGETEGKEDNGLVFHVSSRREEREQSLTGELDTYFNNYSIAESPVQLTSGSPAPAGGQDKPAENMPRTETTPSGADIQAGKTEDIRPDAPQIPGSDVSGAEGNPAQTGLPDADEMRMPETDGAQDAEPIRSGDQEKTESEPAKSIASSEPSGEP